MEMHVERLVSPNERILLVLLTESVRELLQRSLRSESELDNEESNNRTESYLEYLEELLGRMGVYCDHVFKRDLLAMRARTPSRAKVEPEKLPAKPIVPAYPVRQIDLDMGSVKEGNLCPANP